MATTNNTKLLEATKLILSSSDTELAAVMTKLSSSDALKLVEKVSTASKSKQKKTTLRKATVERKTKETQISVYVNLDGSGKSKIDTGIGFLNHMLDALSKHSMINIEVTCNGDLHIDDHHTSEDCALALGSAINKAIGDKKGITRFGIGFAPLDESLSRAVVDFSGRPSAHVDLKFTREKIGDISTEMLTHVFESIAMNANMTLHVEVLKGTNNHHKAESAFKALAQALRQAVAIDPKRLDQIPSTKGTLGEQQSQKP